MNTSEAKAANLPFSDDDVAQFRHLLDEIEREDVPERLLKLAQRLQAELAARRNEERQGSD